MNAIFIYVIVLVKMCFHMLYLCWFKYKKIFEYFRCFWKVFCFYKNWKISKTVLPCFGDSVAGHPSCEIQPRARVLILATCSRVKGLVTRVIQRFSRLSSRLLIYAYFCNWDRSYDLVLIVYALVELIIEASH